MTMTSGEFVIAKRGGDTPEARKLTALVNERRAKNLYSTRGQLIAEIALEIEAAEAEAKARGEAARRAQAVAAQRVSVTVHSSPKMTPAKRPAAAVKTSAEPATRNQLTPEFMGRTLSPRTIRTFLTLAHPGLNEVLDELVSATTDDRMAAAQASYQAVLALELPAETAKVPGLTVRDRRDRLVAAISDAMCNGFTTESRAAIATTVEAFRERVARTTDGFKNALTV